MHLLHTATSIRAPAQRTSPCLCSFQAGLSINNNTMASVKPEATVKADPDEVMASPGGASDDDLYEDAGDLEFYDTTNQSDAANSIYLAHVPTDLYEAWAGMDDDEEIQIGTIRQWNEVDKNGNTKMRLAMLLDHKNRHHQLVPKEYNLEIKDMNLMNTFMFTEQDLPGYKSKAQGGPNRNLPAHLRNKQYQSRDNNGKPEGGRKGRYQPTYRKAIPKKTVLAGRFRHELNCNTTQTPEAKHLLALRVQDAMKPKAQTSMMSSARAIPNGIIQAGTTAGNDKMRNFVRTAVVDQKAAKTKKQKEERAARLDQHVLRDRIFACFAKYNYWSMKAFKLELVQPETWLRENLEEVAVLHKSGPFANHWELKPDYKRMGAMAEAGAAAPDAGMDDESEFDGDDDEIQMEDVIPS